MSAFMKIEGIEGDVTAKGHENWIQIDKIELHIERTLSAEPGRISDRERTRPTLSEITIHKKMDRTSPLLFSESCVGKAKEELLIDICQTNNTLSAYMQYNLSNVIVSYYQVNHENNHQPIETIRLSYDRIEMKYTPYDDQNKPCSPIPAGYDLKTTESI